MKILIFNGPFASVLNFDIIIDMAVMNTFFFSPKYSFPNIGPYQQAGQAA